MLPGGGILLSLSHFLGASKGIDEVCGLTLTQDWQVNTLPLRWPSGDFLFTSFSQMNSILILGGRLVIVFFTFRMVRCKVT